MADRNTKVVLTAQVQGYIDGMTKAAQATRETGSEAEKLGQQAEAFQKLGRASMVMGGLAAAGVGLAAAKWMEFDAAMSDVQAATHESESNMKLLSDAAVDAGARTVFSASEAANAVEELAKAGVSTKDILSGGLNGALDLAAAGNLSVADAAGIAATALKTFKLEGTDMAHVADLLAAGAGKAMGDVTDLSAALNQSAMVANATGLSIEETTAGLAAFASQGLLGSDAGTSFKAMLQSLTPTSGKAADTMRELGISAYDSQGNFVGLAEFAGNLEGALKNLSVEQQQAALKTIFGSDAIRAATVLYSEGEDGIREWTNAVNDQGYAAETARARLDNLKGDLEALGGALESALISTGSAANDTLRDMVQFVTDAVDAYNQLPAPLQSAAMGVGVLTAGVGLLGGGMLVAVPQVVEFWNGLNTLGVTSKSAADALMGVGRFLTGPWGVALAAAATVTAVLVGEKVKLSGQARELANTLDAETGAITENSTAWAANELQQQGVLAAGKRLGISADDMTQAWLGNADALERVNDRLDKFKHDADFRMNNTDWKGWSDDLADVDYALDGSNKVLAEAKTRHEELAEATRTSADEADGAAGAADGQAEALAGLGDAADETASRVSELAEQIRGFGKEQFDVERGSIAFNDALADLAANLESGKASWDVTTEAGRETRNTLLDLANETNNYAGALAAAGEEADVYSGVLDRGRQSLYDTALALTGSEDAARAFADQLVATPETVETWADMHTDEAKAKLEELSGMEVPDKVLEISADAADAYAGIEGVNVRKVDEKTAYVWGDNADANAKIDAVNKTQTPRKMVTINADDSGFQSVWQRIANAAPITKFIDFVKRGDTSSNANGGFYAYANGGIESYAFGGFPTGIYSGGPPIHKFAEPETGWEAYISGKPSERDRNRQIWQETGHRLGMGAGREVVHVPTHVTVIDADNRMIGTMRVVASNEIDGYAADQARANRRAGH